MVRAVLLIAVVILVGAGCGGGEAADEGAAGDEGDCTARLLWNDVRYHSAGSPERPLALGERLGKGNVPRCNGEPGPALDVIQIRGVDPAVAVVIEGEGDPPYAWLAPGYLPESRRHPLHDAIYGGPSEPNAETGFRCEPSRLIRVRALNTPAYDTVFLRVAAEDEESEPFLRAGDVDGIVSLDANTAVVGHERDGIPFIQAGGEFSLVLRECLGTEAEPGLAGLRRLVVKRLGP